MEIKIQVQCILFSIPMALHLVSIYVLNLAKDSNLRTNQRLYFLNLSLSEFLVCFLGILKRVCKIYGWSVAKTYVRFVQAGIATFVYYIIMIALTLDRFFEIFLNIKYPLHFSSFKTKILVISIWALSFIFTGILCFLHMHDPHIPNLILTYFYFVFGIICIAVSIFTYTFIMYKMYVNKVFDAKNVKSVSTDEFKKTRRVLVQSMYLPVLLMITFAVFVMIPEVFYFSYDMTQSKMSEGLTTILTTSYFLAYISDVFMYVLGSKYIRKIIWKKFGCWSLVSESTIHSFST